ncbi:MAG: zinc-ribbon domain-containing protein [Methanobacteriaceae archaeon]
MKDKGFCSHCGERLLEDDKFCTKCGKSRGISKNMLIIGAIALIGVILVGGYLGYTTYKTMEFDNKFPVELTLGGQTFYLPEGYILYDEMKDDEYGVANVYSNNSSILISIHVYPLSLEEATANIKNSYYHIYDYNASFGGYSGLKWGNSIAQQFTFERNGKCVDIGLPPLDESEFNEYVTKIIG